MSSSGPITIISSRRNISKQTIRKRHNSFWDATGREDRVVGEQRFIYPRYIAKHLASYGDQKKGALKNVAVLVKKSSPHFDGKATFIASKGFS